jgi:hypothetical protein
MTISQKCQEKCPTHVEKIIEFYEDFRQGMGSNSKKIGAYSKKLKERREGIQAQRDTDPGLSKRVRDVGLIQDPKTLDQTTEKRTSVEPGLNRSGSGVYKRVKRPVQSISHFRFSLFSHSSERISHFSLTLASTETGKDGGVG